MYVFTKYFAPVRLLLIDSDLSGREKLKPVSRLIHIQYYAEHTASVLNLKSSCFLYIVLATKTTDELNSS